MRGHDLIAHTMIVAGALLCGVAFVIVGSSHHELLTGLMLFGGIALVVLGIWWPPRRWR